MTKALTVADIGLDVPWAYVQNRLQNKKPLAWREAER